MVSLTYLCIQIFFYLSIYSLGAIWDQIQALGNGSVQQILEEGFALLISGQVVLQQAKEIFAQLVNDLTAHTSTASTLVATAIAAVAELLKSNLKRS